jgi:hypothetical protein
MNFKAEVEDAVNRHLKEQSNRIQVVEAIVSAKKYELNEKITSLG